MHNPLATALVGMLALGAKPACSEASEKWLWTSDDAEERALAQSRCRGCPVATQCLQEALSTKASWGVWGGHDVGQMSRSARTRMLAKLTPDPDPDTEPALF